MKFTSAHISLFILVAAFFAVVPMRASASYLPDYPGPTFENIVHNVHELAAAYDAPAVAAVTHVEPLFKEEPQGMQGVDLAYLPQALYDTASRMDDALASVGVAYAHMLNWIGDLQADSYRSAASAVLAYNENFKGFSDAQMVVYEDVSDSLMGGLEVQAAVAQAAGAKTFSLFYWWTNLVYGVINRQAPQAPQLAYAKASDDNVVVAAYTIVTPLNKSQ